MKILFLTSNFPYPLFKGNSLRAFHQIRLLSKNHSIILVSFVFGIQNPYFLQKIKKYCQRVETVSLSLPFSFIRLLKAPFSFLPLQVLLYQQKTMRERLLRVLKEERPDLVHVQLIRMASYFGLLGKIPCVLDLVDALSLNMERRAKRDRFYLRPILKLEAKRLKNYEKKMANNFTGTLITSWIDGERIGSQNLHINPNGVDLDYFQYSLPLKKANSLLFVGNMGYYPNKEAVLHFCKEILPLILKKQKVRFYIVGTNPCWQVKSLAGPDIEVTGRVRDIRPYLRSGAVFVCPLLSGSGIQDKVLEAMASGIPVVAYPQVAASLRAKIGEEILEASSASDFASQALQLLRNPEQRKRISKKARKLIEKKYNWKTSVGELEKIYQEIIKIKP